ncbi:hypothetical protein CALVIDRAFT_126899 [Calocera viscosa TUFC12733]|uniref:Uncharacterized protein n=1 Tax=Calocera viscosa (strain TUFC12733) TaxID=1330018 RepID=A0A167RRM6_CALVF|nr:hypothetical protein CALVIDRAFT_126899 [Calocera viscosa TUFC12733]
MLIWPRNVGCRNGAGRLYIPMVIRRRNAACWNGNSDRTCRCRSGPGMRGPGMLRACVHACADQAQECSTQEWPKVSVHSNGDQAEDCGMLKCPSTIVHADVDRGIWHTGMRHGRSSYANADR